MSGTLDDFDSVPFITGLPGPKGDKGDAGAAGTSTSTNGKNAFTTTNAPFSMPATSAAVTVSVDDTSWMAVGQTVFIETAGYFTVQTVLSATSVSLIAQDNPANSSASTAIATAKKVSPSGIASIDTSALNALDARVTALEENPGGPTDYFQSTAPTGTLHVGDVWYQTSSDGSSVVAQFRWDGTGWVSVAKVLTLADFGTGMRPIIKVSTLPTSGYTDGDFVVLSTDGKLYRMVSGQWTKAVATGDLVGQVDGSTFIVDGTLVAQKFAANSVTANAVGANQVITTSANIGSGVIQDAHISSLSAGKITAGDIQAVNFGHSGRIFHTSYSANKFQAAEFGTSYANSFSFGSGSAFTFTHATPVIAYGPGNGSWGLNGAPTACPDSSGAVRVQFEGRLIGYTGSVLVYGQINSGAFFALACRSSSDNGNAIIAGWRKIGGVNPTDVVKIYVAPADANGNAVAGVTCRYEIDATFYNW